MRKPWLAKFICEQCKQEIERVTVQKSPPRFCSKSCSNKYQHAQGIRRAYCSEKTIEEWWRLKYTDEEIEILKQKMHENTLKDRRRPRHVRCSPEALQNAHRSAIRSWNEKYGEIRASEMKESARINCGWLDKSVEERFGSEEAKAIRAKAGNSNRGQKRSKETRIKMSIAAHNKILENPSLSWTWDIKGWYKGFFFRSSYEYFFMKKLESEGLELKTGLIQENFRVPYSFDGQEHTYIPYFYVPSRATVFEVKNKYALSTDPVVTCKHEAVRSFFQTQQIEFVVLTEDDLSLPKDRRKTIDIISEDPCAFLLSDKDAPAFDFKRMFEEQIKFMNLLVKERGFTNFPVDLDTKEGQKIVKNISHECMHELFEAVHLLSDAKDHKKTLTSDFDKEKFTEELSDALHYFIGVCILCGIDAEKMFGAFMRKGTINFSRILGGY